jgi:hypothetical protein
MATSLQGDKTPDITKVILGGEDKVKIYHKIVESQPTETVTFSDEDIIAYLSELGDIGASKDTQEIALFHLKNTAKLTTGSTVNDLEFTEALTSAAMKNIRAAYKDNSYIVSAIFDEEGNQLYGCFGSISEWGASIQNGDTCTLTYTLAISDDEITCTKPTSQEV